MMMSPSRIAFIEVWFSPALSDEGISIYITNVRFFINVRDEISSDVVVTMIILNAVCASTRMSATTSPSVARFAAMQIVSIFPRYSSTSLIISFVVLSVAFQLARIFIHGVPIRYCFGQKPC